MGGLPGDVSEEPVLILQAFRHFTYITVYSPTLPSLYLRHSSFPNPSVASPTSQLIFQPFCPPLWVRRQHARLSRSGPGFDPRSGQVSWVRFFRGFSSSVRQISGSFRPPRFPNIIWPSLSSSHIIHYGRQ